MPLIQKIYPPLQRVQYIRSNCTTLLNHPDILLLALRLNEWREKTHDVIPSDFAGTRISERYTQTYLTIKEWPALSRSAIAAERGIEMGRDEARTIVYGMPYPEFKARHQAEATPEQLAAFDASRRSP